MKYCCDGILAFLTPIKENEWTRIQKAPDGDGYILTVTWRDRKKKNPKQFGWGMRLCFCPFCGKKLKDKAGVNW